MNGYEYKVYHQTGILLALISAAYDGRALLIARGLYGATVTVSRV